MTATSDLVNAIAGKLTHTVVFERTVQVRPYESAKAGIFIQYSTDRDASPEEIIAGGVQTFSEAKSLVFQQLGLPHDYQEGVVLEIIEGTFGPGTEQKALPAASKPEPAPAPSVDGKDVGTANPPFDTKTTDKAERKANREWAEARYNSHPQEFEDWRPKKEAGEVSANAPDFKHSSGAGYWLPKAKAA